jgi:hypothetical protein
MALVTEEIVRKVNSLVERYVDRDRRMADITAVRRGQMDSVYPDMFPEEMSKPMIANFVDVAARDIAEVLAPLPSFNCTSTNVNSDRAKKSADKRTMIANNYVEFSELQTQMYTGADWYLTYGFLPVFVEADFDNHMPRIRVENPMGSYPEFDRFGRCISFTKKYMKTLRELVNEFPEYEGAIVGPQGWQFANPSSLLELMRYEDADSILLFLPQRNNLVLAKTKNPIKKLSVTIARRPGLDLDDPRGQFDDVLWAQIARARFSLLAMEAAEKSVQAPLVLPNDVSEFAYGPDAVIRTNNVAGVRRVGLELPPAAFQEQQMLEAEMRTGSRYPEGRSGQIDASIITGSGVQALLGGFNTQIQAGQQILAGLFQKVISLCFEMDERLFDSEKTMYGTYKGARYELSYKPSKDVSGDHSVQVRYGLMAGLDPSRALIFSLQALQAGLISKEFIMSELPWSINVSLEKDRMDVEHMRESLSASVNMLTQAIPQMTAGGGDPTDIVEKIAKVIDMKKRGAQIEDAVLEVFAKKAEAEPTGPEEAEPAGQPMPPEAPSAPQENPPQPPSPQQGTPRPPADAAGILAALAGGAG